MRELDCIQCNEDEESESKKKLRAEIEERIKGMNGLVFDFDDSDLDEIQDVIGANSEDEDEAFIKGSENHPIDSAPSPDSVANNASSMETATGQENGSIELKEHNEEINNILLKVKEHVPEKYFITFDEVSGLNIERELFF